MVNGLAAVETPGHMTGHVSIVARSEGPTYVLAGDLTYRQHLLMDDVVDGMTENPAQSLASQRAIKQLARAEPTVLLPAHDPDAGKVLWQSACNPTQRTTSSTAFLLRVKVYFCAAPPDPPVVGVSCRFWASL